MLLSFPKFRFLLIPILALAVLASANPVSKLFWANQIDSAIIQRDSYFRNIGIFTDGLHIDSWSEEQKNQVISKINMVPAFNNSWYNFLKGMLYQDSSGTGRDYFLNKTIFLSENDPGTTWLLFMEYSRYNQRAWADKCIDQLYKLLLKSGARSSTVISRMLIHYALQSENTDKKQALKYYALSKLFNPDQAYPFLRSAWINFPVNFTGTLKELGGYLSLLSQSWEVQLNFVSAFYKWFRLALIVLILAIFITFSIKYLPSALHHQIDLYPHDVSISLRTILISAVFISLITFGIVPLLWLTALLIWRFLNSKEKMFFSVALVFLLLAPVDCYFRNMMNSAGNPEAPVMNFSRAVNEGYSGPLYKQACLRSSKDTSDYLSFLTASIYEAKENRLPEAAMNLEKAIALRPSDPVVLITAGNISYLSGDTEKARYYYQQVIDGYKQSYVSARFNQAQCYLRKMETITGTELINEAAMMKPDYINDFIKENDLLFSREWPVLRQVIFPDYSLIHFWTEIFPAYSGGWKSTTDLWGTTFLGISPLISLIISILLFTAILFTPSINAGHNRIKKLFECRFCGRVICRKCKAGLLCGSCYNETRFIRNEKSLEKMHLAIRGRFENLRSLRRGILEIFFPGSGYLLEGKKPYIEVIPLFILTSFVYSAYAIIFSAILKHHLSLKKEALLILVTLFAYNILFTIKRVPQVVRSFKTLLGGQGNQT